MRYAKVPTTALASGCIACAVMSFLDKLSKYLFVVAIGLALLSGASLYGYVAHRDELPPVPQLRAALELLQARISGLDPDVAPRLQPARSQGEGVTRNLTDDDALVFMAGFFDGETQARLIHRDGTVQAKWSLNYNEHFPDAELAACAMGSPLRYDVHGALLTAQGEIVFNYEYCGTVKLDRCGAVLWTLADQTHHDLIAAEDGGYWLLGRDEWQATEAPERFPPFSTTAKGKTIEEDTLLRIASDGTILEETSIPVLMQRGGLGPLLTATGDIFTLDEPGRSEIVHANAVAELPSALAAAYPLFEAGDLAISMRELNLVIVIDPLSKAIKWHQTGPWLRQHDPEFRSDGRLSIFNNNVYRNAYVNERTDLTTPFATNIIAIGPVSRDTEVVFGERPGQELLSVIRGQHELLPGGGMLITEFDAGRVLEVDVTGRIVWEYVNQYDEKNVAEITNANVYSQNYFTRLPGAEDCP